MIQSLLDQDLYTFTVGQAIAEKYPQAVVEYNYTSRRSTPINQDFQTLVVQEVQNLAKLQLEPDEAAFLNEKAPFLKPSYLGYLKQYRFDPNEVIFDWADDLQTSRIRIVGPWHRTVFWEVPLLAIFSEAYFKTIDIDWTLKDQTENARKKAEKLHAARCFFSDFGTRRRRSHAVQDLVVKNLNCVSSLSGTSNMYFAKKYNLRPIGTMSHQWIMGISALESLRHANRFALQAWNDVYHGDLGIALTDTFGTEAFFEDFDGVLARLFDGVRHDSGDPFKFAERVVQFYHKMHIEPATKTIVFSDSLNVDIACKLKEHCIALGINCAFGIGTFFTNDFVNSRALNMVIKLRAIAKNRQSPFVQVIKLSDDLGKATGDRDALRAAKYVFFGIPLDTV